MRFNLTLLQQLNSGNPDYVNCGQGTTIIGAPYINPLKCKVVFNGTTIIDTNDLLAGFPYGTINDPSSGIDVTPVEFDVTTRILDIRFDNFNDFHTGYLLEVTIENVGDTRETTNTFMIYGYDIGKDKNGDYPDRNDLYHVTSLVSEPNNIFAQVVFWRKPYTNLVHYYGVGSFLGVTHEVKDSDGNVVAQGREGTFCSQEGGTFDFVVTDNLGGSCTQQFVVPNENQAPVVNLTYDCTACSSDCESVVNQNLTLETELDFTNLFEVHKTETIPAPSTIYLFDEMDFVYTIFDVFGNIENTYTISGVSPVGYLPNNSQQVVVLEKIGDYIIQVEVIMKQNGTQVMKCTNSKTLTNCGTPDIVKSDCNKFTIRNTLLTSITITSITEVDETGTEGSPIVENIILATGETYDFTPANDGVFYVNINDGSNDYKYVIVADCNFQTCVFNKIKTISAECNCNSACNCAVVTDARYDFVAALNAANTYFMILNNSGIFSYAWQAVSLDLLATITDIKILLDNMQKYCCTDCNTDCSC